MRRLLRVLLPLIVVVPAIAIAAPVSATVSTKACAGQYELNLTTAMGDLGGSTVTTPFKLTLTEGSCTGSSWASELNGYLTGNCGAATGEGWFDDATSFLAIWAGRSLTVEGEGAGTFVVTMPTDCAGTTSFDAVGAVGPGIDACLGIGTMSLSTRFFPLPGPSRSATFYIGLSLGACATSFLPEGRTFSASGTITGNCGLALGSGTTSDGEPFDIVWALPGGLFLAGNVAGYVNVVGNPISGDECHPFTLTSPGASNFIAQGEVAKLR